MITVTPQSSIKLCKCPLENDYKNQFTFSSVSSQESYFNSKVTHTFSNYTYVKQDNSIKLGINIDSIRQCNYLFYTNTGFSNKRFYCFITDMQYINENCTLVTFETDCFQTWYFQIVYNRCFVEREHVNDDTIGLHTVPENLETGDYIANNKYYYSGLDNCVYVIQCTERASTSDNKPLATNFGGIFMAGGAYVCPDITTTVTVLNQFATRGKSDAVYNVYMIPSKFISVPEDLYWEGQNSPIYDTKNISKINTLNGYTPKNNKLLCFPFNYLLVSNNNGSSNIFHFERFKDEQCKFQIKGVPTVGGSIKIIPTNYDNITNNEEEGLMAGKLPTLNWSNDEYINWLTQNSVNIGLGTASNVLSVVSGVTMMATGLGAISGANSIVSGEMGIANQLGAIYQHSLQPNSAKGNVNGGDINVCDKKNGFTFYKMTIKKEYAQIIDNYFNMFGYKVNTLKVPNITGRQNWNYVKTIDCNFDGDIPQTDLNVIKNMFNNGVTLWHTPENIYKYNLSNNIV